MADDAPVWFITGCSTGFGHELAKAVLDHGHRAVVTARQAASVQPIADRHPDRALALALDVTADGQIAAAVRQAEQRFGRIDVLVNNAGYGYLSSIEEGQDAEIRSMFETNVFGLAALTRAVLPGMRQRRRGHVINIASVGGLVGNAGSGYYAATKFAVEGLSEALAREGEAIGVKVTLVEPGPFRTDWAGRSLRVNQPKIDDYGASAGARMKQIQDRSGRQPGDPARAAAAIIRVVESAKPPLHLILGRPGLEMVEAKLKALHQDIDDWREVTYGADYPS